MTIAEAKRFYKEDKKEYEIGNNKDFINWLKTSIHNGYNCYIDIDELQELIDNIVNWYEIKYPERELEFFEGIQHLNFKDIKSISNVMDLRQLLFRLPHKQLCLIECGYRAKSWGKTPAYEAGKEIAWIPTIYMSIKRKNIEEYDALSEITPYYLLKAEHMTGKILKNYELSDYIENEDNLYLDEVLSILNKKYSDELDFSELKQCIYNHNCDLELRHRILQLSALKLLYSRNTIPERGYKRAKRFINEFNKKLDLTLSTEEIDEIMNRDYTNGEKWEEVLKTYVDEDGNEYSYWTAEDAAKKEKTNGIKRLTKNIFNLKK